MKFIESNCLMESYNGLIANGPKRVFHKLIKYEKSGISTRYQKNVYDGICNNLLIRWHKKLVLFLGLVSFFISKEMILWKEK